MVNKKSNPFNIWLTYVLGFALVIFVVGGFYFGYSDSKIITFLDKVTPFGNFSKMLSTEVNGISISMFNPLAFLTLFFYGFILGWLIYLLARRLK